MNCRARWSRLWQLGRSTSLLMFLTMLLQLSLSLLAAHPPSVAARETATVPGVVVADLTVDGTPVTPELSLDDTALRVSLPAPVPPGESAEIALIFTTTVP